MNCTSLTMAGLLAALSLGIPSLADSIAPGILLPKKNTKSIFRLLQPTENPVPYCLHRMYNFCR